MSTVVFLLLSVDAALGFVLVCAPKVRLFVHCYVSLALTPYKNNNNKKKKKKGVADKRLSSFSITCICRNKAA